MRSTIVLLAGATGMLGARIAHHLLEAEDVALRLLVRPAALTDPGERSGLSPLVERGAELVEGDVTDPASLGRGTDGVDVVVSALQGGREIVVDGQIALARAAASNGVRRILPSDFALDRYFQVRGRVVDVTTDGAADHIGELSQKYLGAPYPWFGGRDQVRVVITIEPEKVSGIG